MEDVKTCIIFDAPFKNEPGHGVAPLHSVTPIAQATAVGHLTPNRRSLQPV